VLESSFSFLLIARSSSPGACCQVGAVFGSAYGIGRTHVEQLSHVEKDNQAAFVFAQPSDAIQAAVLESGW
jgi:hypothetical protein